MNPRYVLVGLAAELSLRPLAAVLREHGSSVSVVDLAESPLDASSIPVGDGPIVLVTSQHLALTGAVYDAYYHLSSHYAAPQTLRRRLGADLLVYVPHDLSEPVLPTEVELLRTLDLYAAPDVDAWWAAAHVPTVVTGWVGTAWWDERAMAEAPLSRGVLFLTQLLWLEWKGGAPFVLKAMKDTLASGIAVKLPVWPGLERLASALESEGIPLVDPHLPAAGIARSTPLIVTNGASSVLAEAAQAGHRPVCVMPPEADLDFAGKFGMLDVVMCRDSEFSVAAGSAGVVRPPGPRFDVERFVGAVTDLLRMGLG